MSKRGRKALGRNKMICIRISDEAYQKLQKVGNKTTFIEELIINGVNNWENFLQRL